MFSGMVKPGEVLERSGVEGIKLAVDSSSRKPERSDVAGTEQVELARDHEDSEVESSRVDFHRRRASASAWPWQGGLPDRAVLKHSMPRSGHLLDESHCASLMIGIAHCSSFADRLYGFPAPAPATTPADPSIWATTSRSSSTGACSSPTPRCSSTRWHGPTPSN
ncbi:hypothetical protein HU200_003624 [Digitaria exilis]|uniref:Uncharacterized protein n=1 Tax=Digitaria exilis TaxID=1010633 RepID=A0A835FV70_9POAL|nr:hypothetical protein HU200_003624 [Digitaria exilis]